MPSIPASQASTILSSFSNFLTVAIHCILYHRKLYPSTTFLTTRAYNLAVHQSRHPGVCTWVRDAVAAVIEQIRLGTASSAALVLHSPPPKVDVLERWVFDLSSFPDSWAAAGTVTSDVDSNDVRRGDDIAEEDEEDDPAAAAAAATTQDTVNLADVHEALRGALARISYTAESKEPVPEGCTFTVAVELKDEASAPVGVSQHFSQRQTQPQDIERATARRKTSVRTNMWLASSTMDSITAQHATTHSTEPDSWICSTRGIYNPHSCCTRWPVILRMLARTG